MFVKNQLMQSEDFKCTDSLASYKAIIKFYPSEPWTGIFIVFLGNNAFLNPAVKRGTRATKQMLAPHI